MADDINQYSLADLGQLVTGRSHFPVNPSASESYLFHRNLAPLAAQHETVMVGEVVLPGGGLVRYGHDSFTSAIASTAAAAPAITAANSSSRYALDMESGWSIGNEGGNCRWPRQETLTLLEIRSRLDSKFKEANQKKPLWDEVSRIMAEEHGYHRSEKKCREKFENLYKYYKKTKEGKAGRQDGKHYRFFRQLEALYGETSNNNININYNNQNSVSESQIDQNNATLVYQNPNNQESFPEQKQSDQSLSFSNTSEFETASSGNNDNDDLSAIAFMMNQKSKEKQKGINNSCHSGPRVKKGWKAAVKEYVDSQMQNLVESQEAWMERMLKTIEDKEQERLSREERWRSQELARFDQVNEFWVKERAWVEARDAVVMEALKKFSGKGIEVSSSADALASKRAQSQHQDKNAKKVSNRWNEPETSSLVQLVTSFETKFQESGRSNENIWVDIAANMANLGYYRSATECQEKWEDMKMYFNMATEWNKKRKEDLGSSSYCRHDHDSSYHRHEVAQERLEGMDLSANSYAGTQVHDGSCFHILINEEENLWDKGKNHQQLNLAQERENLSFSP